MRPIAAIIVAIAVVPAACAHRTVVTQPALTVRVTDAAGAPIGNADVVVRWWSYPYHRVHEVTPYHTAADGTLILEQKAHGETVNYACMHGVPEHHVTLCIGAAGFAVEERDARDAGTELVVALQPGSYAGDCARQPQDPEAPAN